MWTKCNSVSGFITDRNYSQKKNKKNKKIKGQFYRFIDQLSKLFMGSFMDQF